MTVQIPEDDDTDLAVQYIYTKGKFTIVGENNEVLLDETNVKKSNIVLLTIGIILFAISAFGILNIIRKIISADRRTDYEVALNRILKNYGDIVAEIVTPTETGNMRVIDVKNFDQLLDIEEEIRMPILFYETVEGEEGEFTIIYDNIVYRYILGGRK